MENIMTLAIILRPCISYLRIKVKNSALDSATSVTLDNRGIFSGLKEQVGKRNGERGK